MTQESVVAPQIVETPEPKPRRDAKPRYLQLAEQLQDEIRRGLHPVGSALPTEWDLASRFGVSRHTVREALRCLAELDLVARRQGSGTTVRATEPHVQYNQFVRSIDDLLQYGHATNLTFLYSDRVAADATLASWLDARIGAECVVLHGIRHYRRGHTPFCVTDVYRRATMHGLPGAHPTVEDAVRALLETEFYKRVGRVEQDISAVAMPEGAAAELQVAAGIPALRALRRYFDMKDRMLLVAVTLHPGESYTYSAVLQRGELAGAE